MIKKFATYIMLLAMISVSIPLNSQPPCVTYHRKGCSQASEAGFIYNSQSKSGLFAKGTTSKLKCIFYEGFDYSISICNDRMLGSNLGFTLTDVTTGDVLYDNATDEQASHMEFSCETTRNMVITITIPGGMSKGQASDGGCVGVLIEQKPTPKVGF